MAYITVENISINNIIGEITIKNTRNYSDSPYIGSSGSSTTFVSELGRTISFKNIIPKYEQDESGESFLNMYKELAATYKDKPAILTSESDADLKGNYLITEFSIVEDTGSNFTLEWELQEIMPFNSTRKTFRVWGSASTSATTSTTKKTTTTVSKSTANANTKKLLTSCGALAPSNTAKTCVKYLQKFLQAVGYYKNYKIDGKYQTYTKQAVKSLQKKYKLPYPTGNWNKSTINYFKKKYKLN